MRTDQEQLGEQDQQEVWIVEDPALPDHELRYHTRACGVEQKHELERVPLSAVVDELDHCRACITCDRFSDKPVCQFTDCSRKAISVQAPYCQACLPKTDLGNAPNA